jgi:drug/metabolite transporter (DMT)-like permease
VFAFLAQMWAIRRTSAARASLLMGTEPIWAVLVGVSLGSETLGLIGAAGAILIVAGTFWGQRIEAGHRTSSAQPG